MEKPDEILNGLMQELRRGTIVLGVLSQLLEPRYGYALVQRLTEAGMPAEAGTLYPLLRRLEKQGLLASKWETEGSKPRKYYVTTPVGKEVYQKLCLHWNALKEILEEMITGKGERDHE
ncbi:MAG: PadR family transcriptional regulator [Christensenella sp.]|nr:PadR family transcriptional regulator [Christensenella sp.]